MCHALGAKDWYIRQCHIPRCSLLSVSKSLWCWVFMSRDDQVMITLTGFDLESFHYLLHLFAAYEQYTPFMDADGYIIWKVSLTRRRPRLMNPTDCQGLMLAWSGPRVH